MALKWGKIDPNAKPNSTPSINVGMKPFTNINQLKEDITVGNYATVSELNQTFLDDEQNIFPDDPQNYKWGIFSDKLSLSDGTFQQNPIVTVSFSVPVDTAGVTLAFYDTFAQDVNIKWYSGSSLLHDLDFKPDNVEYFCANSVQNYTRLIIEFKSLLPYRHLKIKEIMYGQIKIIGDSELQSATLKESAYEASNQVRINTLNCSVHSLVDNFDLVGNPGEYDLIKIRQPVEELNGYGTFYIDEFSASENDIYLSLVDLLGVIGDVYFEGGMFNTTFESFINKLATDANTSYIFAGKHNGFDLADDIKNIPVVGYLKETTIRNALQDVCMASNVVCDKSRSDKIKLYRKPTNVQGTFYDSYIILGDKTEMNKFYTGVDITAYQYTVGESQEEIFKDDYTIGTFKYECRDPLSNYSIQGATITKQNPNFVWFNVMNAGVVTLTAKKYSQTQKHYKQELSGLTQFDVRDTKEIKGNTLINFQNADSVKQNCFEYFTNKYKTEYSLLSPAEVAKIYTANGFNGRIEKQDIDLITSLAKVVATGGS